MNIRNIKILSLLAVGLAIGLLLSFGEARIYKNKVKRKVNTTVSAEIKKSSSKKKSAKKLSGRKKSSRKKSSSKSRKKSSSKSRKKSSSKK